MRARVRTALLATLVAVAGTAVPLQSLHAQVPPELPEARAHRALGLGGAAFLGTARPAVLIGGLYQLSLVPVRTVDEDGVQVRRVPSWYLHLSPSAGWSFARDPDGGAVAVLNAGVVRRVQPTMISAAGPVATGVFGPGAWGAGLRIEIADNIGVQAGWTRRTGTEEDRFTVSVDVLRCLLRDLELGPCLGPSGG